LLLDEAAVEFEEIFWLLEDAAVVFEDIFKG